MYSCWTKCFVDRLGHLIFETGPWGHICLDLANKNHSIFYAEKDSRQDTKCFAKSVKVLRKWHRGQNHTAKLACPESCYLYHNLESGELTLKYTTCNSETRSCHWHNSSVSSKATSGRATPTNKAEYSAPTDLETGHFNTAGEISVSPGLCVPVEKAGRSTILTFTFQQSQLETWNSIQSLSSRWLSKM